MKVLGIESTCDETAIAIVEDGKTILAETIASQADLHTQYGGVYPELACRRHFDILFPLIKETLNKAGLTKEDIDLIAVAHGPGLIGALLMGLSAAKGLALSWNKPFVGVNHVEAHLYAAMMPITPEFPALGVVLSGGHTLLVKIHSLGRYEEIGSTVDDAIGEAFDKVAVLLDLPYPGGPEIEKLARLGDPKKYPFKPGSVKQKPWNFSFSGLKTNVLYTLKGQNCDRKAPSLLPDSEKAHVAAGFQEAALGDIVKKTLSAAESFDCKMIFLGGGVTQNKRLRELLQKSPLPVFFPPPGLSLDNASMIAGLGYQLFLRKEKKGDPLDLEPLPRIPLNLYNKT
ncbi:MAG: tRNA (adenosine(37)-N6)-threonylcarbamoyltransferase complex transferase subunit TsaD [Rhabdochlamydiaceae bacterium]|nr:tRNA (adenosine(37)-N6)-threonylcarbamoyltransferase complex transferase subunit TsaD [Rhabdochlamydiaceae bacterium]